MPQSIAPSEKSFGEALRYDPQFRGPLHKRSCTDVICLLIFFVCLVVYGFIGYYAYREGDLNKLLVPRDSNGLKCGVDSEVRDKPFLVFFNLAKCADPLVPITGCPTPQACVTKCPTDSFIHSVQACNAEGVEEYKKRLICDLHVDKNAELTNCNDIDKFMEADRCAKWYIKSDPLFNHCISDVLPSSFECNKQLFKEKGHKIFSRRQVSSDGTKCERVNPLSKQLIIEKVQSAESFLGLYISNILSKFTDKNDVQGIGQLVVEDVMNSWPVMTIGIVLSVLACLIFIAVMRWIASPIIWLSITGIFASLSYGVYFSFLKYQYFKANPVVRHDVQPNVISFLKSWFERQETWLYLLIGLSVILIIFLLVVLVLRKRIVIAIALVKEGSKAVSSNLSTVCFPLFPWIFQVLVIFYALLVFLHLASIGDPLYRVVGLKNSTSCTCSNGFVDGDVCTPEIFNGNCSKKASFFGSKTPCTDAACHFIEITAPPLVAYFQYANGFGFFWLVFFISAFGEMTLAAVFATWYWTFNKSDVPFFTLTQAIYRTFRFHLGTLAFGSLIIAICRIIRLILEYVDRKLKKYDNEVTKAILCCCKCFFWCLENFLKFMNRNAYIMTAIHGKNFCASSKDAFNLLMRNLLRVVAVDQVTDFLFFLSKILISIGTSFTLYSYLSSELLKQHFPGMLIHYEIGPSVILFIATYFIASVFFSVYSIAVDTLFLSFLEDCERNDGSHDRPFFMPKSLMKILGNKNK